MSLSADQIEICCKNDDIGRFLNLLNQENSFLNIQEIFNNMDYDQLLVIKDSFN